MSDLSAISHCSSESSIGSASQSVSSVGAPQFPTSTATVTSTLASPRTPLTSVEQSVRSELLSMRQSIAEWHQLMRDSADRTDAHDATLDQHRAQLETIAGTLSDLIEFKRQDEVWQCAIENETDVIALFRFLSITLFLSFLFLFLLFLLSIYLCLCVCRCA